MFDLAKHVVENLARRQANSGAETALTADTSHRLTSLLAVRLLALLTIVFLSGPPATAQQSGRWWWTARVGLSGRATDRFIDDRQGTNTNFQGLLTSAGLNGFIVHPAVARFNVDVEYFLTDFQNGTDRMDQQVGFGGEIELFQKGSVPSFFRFSRRNYNYTFSDEIGPRTLQGLPNLITTWGGRVRVRRGIFRGTSLGFDHWSTDFADRDSSPEIHDTQFINWNRGWKSGKHTLTLRRSDDQFGTAGYRKEDYTLNLDERFQLSSRWRWNLLGIGITRDLERGEVVRNRYHNYSVLSEFFRPSQGVGVLRFQLRANGTRSEPSPWINSRSVGFQYSMFVGPDWEISPFGTYDHRTTNGLSVEAPRVGVSVAWTKSVGTLSSMMRLRTAYGSVETRNDSTILKENIIGHIFTTTLGHGEPQGLRKELQIEVTRDELTTRDTPIVELPNLGLATSAVIAHNAYRARLSLSHAWGSRQWKTWAEWTVLESPGVDLRQRTARTSHGFATFNSPRWSLRADGGFTEILGTRASESIHAFGGSVTWKPMKILRLSLAHRQHRVDIPIAPDNDSEQTDIGAALELGRLILELFAHEHTQRIDQGPETTYRTFRWSVSTRFSGWLPFVTGTKTRGVIR